MALSLVNIESLSLSEWKSPFLTPFNLPVQYENCSKCCCPRESSGWPFRLSDTRNPTKTWREHLRVCSATANSRPLGSRRGCYGRCIRSEKNHLVRTYFLGEHEIRLSWSVSAVIRHQAHVDSGKAVTVNWTYLMLQENTGTRVRANHSELVRLLR